MSFVWLTEDDVEAIHDEALESGGGAEGWLNQTHLPAALSRPKNKKAYEDATVYECATAYVFGIAKAHAFNDGNKRTAYLSALVFLALNGHSVNAPDKEAAEAVEFLTTGAMSEEEFSEWLGRRSS